MSEDTTRDVVRRHLDAWKRGDIPALLADYTDDIVMLSGAVGAITGKDAIAAMYAQVFDSMFRPEDTTLEVTAEVYTADFALVNWTAKSSAIHAVGGFDTFVMRGDKICRQAGGAEMQPLA